MEINDERPTRGPHWPPTSTCPRKHYRLALLPELWHSGLFPFWGFSSPAAAVFHILCVAPTVRAHTARLYALPFPSNIFLALSSTQQNTNTKHKRHTANYTYTLHLHPVDLPPCTPSLRIVGSSSRPGPCVSVFFDFLPPTTPSILLHCAICSTV